MKNVLVAAVLAGSVSTVIGQTKLDAVVRPRMEYRDGFGVPSSEGQVGANWVQQRTRISLTTQVKGVELKIVPQDIRVWGAVRSLSPNDNLNSLYEGWMKFNLDSAGTWSMKLGRQELKYDDARILGNVDWAQQGRVHDAGLLRYKKGSSKLDLAVAYNQNAPNNIGNQYTLAGQTKGLQMVHFNTKIKGAKASFLAMNNLFQNATGGNTVHAVFTAGTYWKFGNKESKFVGDAAAYFQEGTLASGTATRGYLASANLLYKTPKTKYGVGAEIISGTDMDDTSGDNYSFNPIYGTNHKFNGLMDYFYVGNHGGNVGLIDLNAKIIYPFSKKFKAIAMFHQFNAAANVVSTTGEDASANLGQEVDFVFKYGLNDNVKIAAGYSQYFSTTSLSFVKGLNNTSNINHWGWVMVTGSILKMFEDKK